MKNYSSPGQPKILVLAKEWQLGGVAREFNNLLPHLRSHSQVSLLSYCRIGQPSTVGFHQAVFLARRPPRWRELFHLWFKLRRVIVKAKPDLVIAVDHPTAIMFWSICWSLKHRTPWIISHHLANDYFFRLPWYPPNLVRSLLIRFSYRKADAIQTVSYHLKHWLVALGIPARKVVVVPSSYSVKQLPKLKTSAKKYVGGEPLRLLYLGRLSEEKNLRLVIETFRQLPKTVADHLNLVGSGPQQQPLQTLIDGYGLADRITFRSPVASPYQALARADLLLLLSRAEASPHVLIEAMVSGVPFITSLPHLQRELGAHRECFMTTTDPKLVARKIVDLSRQTSLYRKIVQYNRRAVKTFASDLMAAKHQELFERVLRSTR